MTLLIEEPLTESEPELPPRRRLVGRPSKRVVDGSRYTMLGLLALMFFIPVFGTLLTSVRTVEDISQNGAWTIPRTFSLSNYVEATERLLPHYQASAITTIPSVLLACFIGAMAGYALSQLQFRGRNFVFLGLIAGGFVPIHVQLIPVFKLMNTLGLYDSYIGLISVHTMRSLSMAVLILTNFFGAVPKTLREAASIDGASEFKIFYKVFLPLTRPALAALFIFLFTWVWNDLLWGLVLAQSDNKRPITAGILSFQGEFDVQWPMLATGSVLATLPTVIVFLAFQRHFINGLTMGAVKG